MNCPKSLRIVHEEVQQKIFVMLPEKWEKLYLYASVIDHFKRLADRRNVFLLLSKGNITKKTNKCI